MFLTTCKLTMSAKPRRGGSKQKYKEYPWVRNVFRRTLRVQGLWRFSELRGKRGHKKNRVMDIKTPLVTINERRSH